MSIREWFATFRQRRDAAAVARAEVMANETPEERAVSSGDIAGMAADERAARIAGQTPSEADQVGD